MRVVGVKVIKKSGSGSVKPGYIRIKSATQGSLRQERCTGIASGCSNNNPKRKGTTCDHKHPLIDKLHPNDNMTLRDFVENYWYPNTAKQKLSPKSLAVYEAELTKKILPVLGDYDLTEIRPIMVQSFYASFSQPGAKVNGGAYSLGTIRKTATVLSSVMHSAQQLELIPRNPCSGVSLDGPRAPQIKFFTPEQAVNFLRSLEEPYVSSVEGFTRHHPNGSDYSVSGYEVTKWVPLQMQVLFNLALFTGARKGELLALQWKDIDFVGCMISINKAVSVVKGQQIVKAPKTASSVREVAVSSRIMTMLQKLRQQQDARRAESQENWNPEGWLFTTIQGNMMCYYTPLNALKKLIGRYNENKPVEERLPIISFHALRHTNATMLIAAKQDIETVAKRLGHASAKVTLGVYGHPLKEGNYKAASVLDRILTPNNSVVQQEMENGKSQFVS